MGLRVVVTHTDLDGIASAALILRELGGIDRLYFIQPHRLYSVLARVPNGAELYITDLGANSSTISRVVAELRRVVRSGGRVRWFDHHVWDGEWVSAVTDAGAELYIDRGTCATDVVAKNLPVRDPTVRALVDATCSVDLWVFNHWLGNYLSRFAGFRGGSEWKGYVVRKLASFSGELDEEVLGVVEKCVDRELSVIGKALRRAGLADLGGLKVVYYLKGDEEHLTSYIANALMSRFSAEVAVICRRGSVSLRSRGVNVREVAKALGGGGHTYAAGAPLKPPLYIRLLYLLGIRGPHLKWCVRRVLKHSNLLTSSS